MTDEIKYVKDIRILKESTEPDLMAIKAKGIASLKKLVAPVLIPKQYDTEPEDGIFELDFALLGLVEGFAGLLELLANPDAEMSNSAIVAIKTAARFRPFIDFCLNVTKNRVNFPYRPG